MNIIKLEKPKEVMRFVSLLSGTGKLLRSDGKILIRYGNKWKIIEKLKEEITIEQYIESIKQDEKDGKIIIGVTPPSYKKLEKWAFEGVCETPCGCLVEPDGICEHGNKSWLLLLSYV